MFRGIELNNYAIHVPVIQLLYSAILSFLQAKSIPPVLKWTLTDSTLNYSRPNLYSGGGRGVRILLGKFGIQLLKFTTSILEKIGLTTLSSPPPPPIPPANIIIPQTQEIEKKFSVSAHGFLIHFWTSIVCQSLSVSNQTMALMKISLLLLNYIVVIVLKFH